MWSAINVTGMKRRGKSTIYRFSEGRGVVTNGAENYYKTTFPCGKIYYKAIYTGEVGSGYHMDIFPGEMAMEEGKYYS